MIKIYTSPSCSSCRKVKQWFKNHKIPFEEVNIFTEPLTESDLKSILFKTDNGTEDIISSRSKIVKEQHIDLDSMTLNEMITFIRGNPSVLKRPIIVDSRNIQVGYNPEDIEMFIPKAKRMALLHCSAEKCAKYIECDHRRDRDGEE